jgi:heme exporter protein C
LFLTYCFRTFGATKSGYFLKGKGWKFAGAFILLAVIVSAFLIPLGPGILAVRSGEAMEGRSLTVEILGHSTGFTQKEPVKGWLLGHLPGDTISLCSTGVEVVSDTVVRLKFDIPANIVPGKDESESLVLDCLVGSASCGTLVNRSSVIVKNNPTLPGTHVPDSYRQCKFEEIKRAQWVFDFPFRENLFESIRNLFFHVPMWFVMMSVYFASCYYSIMYLRKPNEIYDLRAVEFANTGTLFGLLGLCTGMLWARMTWGDWWSNDPKQTSSAILLLIYFAYFVLRSSLQEEHQRARVSAVYNIFAAASMIPLLFIIPNQNSSLHPGDGTNSPFSDLDLDNKLRLIFYPACMGWILLGFWITNLRSRYRIVKNRILENE